MADTHETGHPHLNANELISDFLAHPPRPDWTVDDLAERILNALVENKDHAEMTLDGNTLYGPARRLLRPLLACFATKAAAESGTPTNLYGGRFSFQRPGPSGIVLLQGWFENRLGNEVATIRRANSPLQPEPKQSESVLI